MEEVEEEVEAESESAAGAERTGEKIKKHFKLTCFSATMQRKKHNLKSPKVTFWASEIP